MCVCMYDTVHAWTAGTGFLLPSCVLRKKPQVRYADPPCQPQTIHFR